MQRIPLKVFFTIFCCVICFSHLHQGTLAVDAIRYARISWEMVLTGNPIPFDHFTATPYYNKPPLLFWLTAVTFKHFGFSTLSAKVPAVSFTFAALIGLYIIGGLRAARIGAVAGLLIILSPNFTKNMLVFSFEGMVAFGTALWLLGLLAWDAGSRMRGGLMLMLAVILIAQSKPPYLALLFLAALPLIPNLTSKTVLPAACILVGATIGGSWYLYRGAEYIQEFTANQVGVSLTHRYSYIENLLRWFLSLLKNFPLIIIPGLPALSRILRRFNSNDFYHRLLAIHSLLLLPIVLFIAIRPRYLIVPMISLAPLAAEEITTWFKFITEARLKYVFFAVSLCFLLLTICGVSFHGTSEFVTYIRTTNAKPGEITFFQCAESMEKARGKARMAELLLELEFGAGYRVVPRDNMSDEISGATFASGC